jgi:hypothetical protein
VRSNTIQVRTLQVVELVQKGHALALKTGDTELQDRCASLLSAVVPGDVKNRTVRIKRVPHEQQIEAINNAIVKGASHE